MSEDEISKLAYDVGGVAHVLVEPNRSFSFKLREMTEGANAYGGTVGISVPGAGLVRRMFLGWLLPDSQSLANAARISALEVRSLLPAVGLDWTELQELALRKTREQDRNALTFKQLEDSYLEEIDTLREQIRQLKDERSTTRRAEIESTSEVDVAGSLGSVTGPEIYDGEVSDRLCYAAKIALDAADRVGLDARSRYIFDRVSVGVPRSPGLADLRESLKRAVKDPKKIATQVSALLGRHGYHEKSDNKHIRLEADAAMGGLDAITLPKTPSDSHGLENLRKQIEGTLGLKGL